MVLLCGVYAVYRMNNRITITPPLSGVMLGGVRGWRFTGQVQAIVILASSRRQRAHGQRVLLVNSVQLFGAHGVSDELKLLRERLAAVCHADIGDVGTADVVAFGALPCITGAQPVAFGLEVGEHT